MRSVQMHTNGSHFHETATILLFLIIRQVPNKSVIMGQKRDLTSNEKSSIVPEIGKMKTTLEISKILRRGHRNMKKFEESSAVHSRADMSKWRVVSRCTLSLITREVARSTCLTSREVFKRCGREDISKSTRCSLLKQVAKNVQPVTIPPLKAVHKQNRVK
ncbi:Hypothetical predicted protein [Octopus vulgaris]|uniref:Uncharacterized protein n=1 Tax=Octopus vulgaris TaxID=6645 RepID=A0AA36AHN9_OCTVU|nr:Hypothetical predicted protein [Octopus vulgaris]